MPKQDVRGKTLAEHVDVLVDRLLEERPDVAATAAALLKALTRGSIWPTAYCITCACFGDAGADATVAILSVHMTQEDALENVRLILAFRKAYAHAVQLAQDAQETPEHLRASVLEGLRAEAYTYCEAHLCNDVSDSQAMLVDNKRLMNINVHPLPLFLTSRDTAMKTDAEMSWVASPLNLPEATADE